MTRDLSTLLDANERVVVETRQHWFVLVRSAWLHLAGLLASLLLMWVVAQPTWLDNVAGTVLTTLLRAVAVIFVLLILWKVLAWSGERFYLTTTKVVLVRGVLNRSTVTTPLVRVHEVTLVRPFVGRILGFGRLDVDNAGQGMEPLAGLEYLPRPDKLYQEISERARHQRMLEGGGRQDVDGDGFVDDVPRAHP